MVVWYQNDGMHSASLDVVGLMVVWHQDDGMHSASLDVVGLMVVWHQDGILEGQPATLMLAAGPHMVTLLVRAQMLEHPPISLRLAQAHLMRG